MADPLPPGSIVGILGGGQLGRMLAVAASRLGLRAAIYDPAARPPAADVTPDTVRGDWDDAGALSAFAARCDVVTYEFENVPAASLDAVEAAAPVFPPRAALATSQDRLTEKTFLSDLGLATAPYAPVTTAGDLAGALERIGVPAILKTRRLGYDGKGQAAITAHDDAAAALAAMAGADAILEGRIAFLREISVIAARAGDGTTIAFEPGENRHERGILRTTTVPAALPREVRDDAVTMAVRILDALGYVGVIGVELFQTETGLLVNEFAPRVHNSGHWTMDGAVPDQFEAHIRAVANWPLPAPVRTADVVMENLIGDEVVAYAEYAARPGVALHLYGKRETRVGRKMGHLNRIVDR